MTAGWPVPGPSGRRGHSSHEAGYGRGAASAIAAAGWHPRSAPTSQAVGIPRQTAGARGVGLVAGAIARALIPNDAFRHMHGWRSWLTSTGLGLLGALVGFWIFHGRFGIGDTNKFDWGGIVGAVIGAMIVVAVASFPIKRFANRPVPVRAENPVCGFDQQGWPSQPPDRHDRRSCACGSPSFSSRGWPRGCGCPGVRRHGRPQRS